MYSLSNSSFLKTATLAIFALVLFGPAVLAQGVSASTGDIRVDGDFDNDGKLDYAVFRPSNGTWYIQESSGPSIEQQWGLPGDIPVAADYNGDGKTDYAVWRPSTGTWLVLINGGGTSTTQWGLPGDVPVVGDFDGDGKADFVVFRPSSGVWYCLLTTKGVVITQWGLPGDIPVAADYDGNGATDIAVWRPSQGIWYVLVNGTTPLTQGWGLPGDIPVVADFDNDAKSDFAIWRPSEQNLYIMPSSGGTPYTQQSPPPNQILASKFAVGALGKGVFYRVTGDFDGDGKLDFAVFDGNANPNVADPNAGMWFIVPSSTPTTPLPLVQFGLGGDIPVPGFYESDTRSDVAVFRPSNGTWYIKPSNGNPPYSVQWGATNDIPVLGDFDGDGITDFVVWRPSNGVWYLILSSQEPSSPVIQPFGMPGDLPMASRFYPAADASDLVVWRPSNGKWYLRPSSNIGVPGPAPGSAGVQWGLPGDLPTAGDFDNDGRMDFAVWRPSLQTYYLWITAQPLDPANKGVPLPLGQTDNATIYNQPPMTPFLQAP